MDLSKKIKKYKKILESKKFKKIIVYGFSGAMTTVISFVTFKLFLEFMQYIFAFSLSWLIAVTFAFLSTRKKVYESKACNKKEVLREYMRFIVGRIITYVINLILLVIAVELFKFDEFYSNVVITVVVIILNYFIGDLMINKLKMNKIKEGKVNEKNISYSSDV